LRDRYDITCIDVYRISLLNQHFGAFTRQNSLTSVKLDGTGITEINTFAFLLSPNLKKIHIKSSPITLVKSRGFAECSSLESINIEKNDIRSFEAKAFSSLPALTSIKFKDNPITALPVDLFFSIKPNVYLDFDGCDKLVPTTNTIQAFCGAPGATIKIKDCTAIYAVYNNNAAFKNAINNQCNFSGGNLVNVVSN
jgi:Leucine-rich repeat (LRR) protein